MFASPRYTVATVGGALAAFSLLLAPAVAADEGYEVVADGLNNPRHLSFSRTGDLYIAEAGLGSDGDTDAPSFDGPEGLVYLGFTGSVTRVTPEGHQSRVLTGLPSTADEQGMGASGPTDVDVMGPQRYAVTVGMGGEPEDVREALGEGSAWLGTLLTGTFASKPRLQADLAWFEVMANPDSGDPGTPEPDSNPGGMVRVGGGTYVVVDAGGNTLLQVKGNETTVLAVFPERFVPFPFPPPPDQVPMDAVPTSVTVGPDGAYYVSQLTGFPFPVGGSSIWRVVPGEDPEMWASGLTTVTDLAWHGDELYAVQIFDDGLFGFFTGPGSLAHVTPDGDDPSDHLTVAGDLPAPYGVVVKGGDAYVTTGSVFPAGGQVLRIPLD
ncbi:MAG: ScyD/ScyE family protein [Actinomycetota bacterium]